MRTAIVVGACTPLVASCATGWGAPTRHAVANLQAASVDVGPNLQIHGLIVALPDGTTAAKGGVAYIQFTAVNLSDQPDELKSATAQVDTPAPSPAASAAASSAAPAPTDVSSQQLPVGSTTIPAKTTITPGTARLVVALDPLNVPLAQGESVRVSLQFANSGTVGDIDVPVQGSDVVSSSFLPSAPPSLPASAPPAASSPAPIESAPASAPASTKPTPATSSVAASPAT